MTTPFLSLLLPAAMIYIALLSTSFANAPLPLRAGVSLGLGWGFASLLFFFWALIAGPQREGLVAIELALLVLAAALWITSDHKSKLDHLDGAHPVASDAPMVRNIAIALFALALLLSFVEFFWLSFNNPHGSYDAWAIWNLKARFFSRGGDGWDNFIDFKISAPDYPLATPALIGSRWAQFTFNDSPLTPILVSFGYTFGAVAILYGALSRANGALIAAIAGIALLSSRQFVAHGLDQFADLPLSFLYLGFLSLFALGAMETGSNRRLLHHCLSGAFLGLAVWTKNEGTLFFVAATISIGLFSWRSLPPVLFGAIPGVLVTAIFKLSYPSSNYVLNADRSPEILARLFDLEMYKIAISAAIKYISSFGQMSVAGYSFGSVIVVAVAVMIWGVRRDGAAMRVAKTLSLTLATTMAGYIVVLVSSNNLMWQMGASLERLLVQLWPGLVFVCFFIAAQRKDIGGATQENQDR